MTTINQGDVLVAADADSLARIAAHFVRAWLWEASLRATDGVARIAVSGGTTPRAMNRVLAGLDVPWDKTEIYWVDERCVPASSPRSNFGNAKEDLLSTQIRPIRAVHPMYGVEGVPTDPAEAARAYENLLLKSFGGTTRVSGGTARSILPVFDVVLLGIGDDGHTASLFPGEPHVEVANRWVVDVPGAEGREPRITLTRVVITAARRVVVLAQGEKKRGPIASARREGPLRDVPARITREVRGELLWLVDAAARPT